MERLQEWEERLIEEAMLRYDEDKLRKK